MAGKPTTKPTIRATIAADEPHLQRLYGAAFPEEDLFALVRRLLASEPGVVSLVAAIGEERVGHILFTPCGVGDCQPRVVLLGPLAVAPARQGQGIGGALVREGCRRLGRSDHLKVLVLGDPAYYGRFGFRPETSILPPYDLPADWSDAWQSVTLDDGGKALAGILRPPAAWLSPSLWAP
jgi:putative acetyltransferase